LFSCYAETLVYPPLNKPPRLERDTETSRVKRTSTLALGRAVQYGNWVQAPPAVGGLGRLRHRGSSHGLESRRPFERIASWAGRDGSSGTDSRFKGDDHRFDKLNLEQTW
jgi:hypothetical protein